MKLLKIKGYDSEKENKKYYSKWLGKIRVKQNIYGNYICYIGREKVEMFQSKYDADLWIENMISQRRAK